MARLDPEVVRHALSVARQRGYVEVELGAGGETFHAKLEPGFKPKPPPSDPASDPAQDGSLKPVKSPLVGYLRRGAKVGDRVKAGEVLAVIEALGIANDVETKIGGEVVEVLAKEGDAVEFGQVLVKVKVTE